MIPRIEAGALRALARLRFLLIPIATVVFVSGCSRGTAFVPTSGEAALRDSVLSVLLGADQGPFRSAFSKLSSYDFTRYIRTEQYDGDDFLIAFEEHIVDVSSRSGERITRMEQADSAGNFEFGFFKRFVSDNVDNVDPVDLVPYVLPEDVGYRNPRDRDKYRYRFLPDTLLWDQQVQVVEARAKPELADGLNVRRVRHYIDRETGELMAVYLERIDLAMLFREESQFYVHVRPNGKGVVLPYNTRFQTLIMTPFRDPNKIRTVSTYSNLRRARTDFLP
jgi:hypothetical protein